MLASGIIDLILATIILAGLPGTAAWAIGLLVGINMVFGGSALIAMELHAREIDPRSAAPRARAALGCPGALREAALIGKNLIQETFGAGARRGRWPLAPRRRGP